MGVTYLLGLLLAFGIGLFVGRPAAKRALRGQDFIVKISRAALCVCTGTAAVISFQLSASLVQSSFALLTYPRFDAEVTAAEIEIYDERKITEDGHRFIQTRTFYRPTVSFIDALGDDVTVELETGSYDRPVVGSMRRIAYTNGHAITIEPDTFIKIIASHLFALCIVGFLIFVWIYGRDIQVDKS